VVSSAKVLKMHSETFRRTDHPGCAISVASRLFVSAQPPLLYKEGKASCPTSRALYQHLFWNCSFKMANLQASAKADAYRLTETIANVYSSMAGRIRAIPEAVGRS
jgi:hypothetical protein